MRISINSGRVLLLAASLLAPAAAGAQVQGTWITAGSGFAVPLSSPGLHSAAGLTASIGHQWGTGSGAFGLLVQSNAVRLTDTTAGSSPIATASQLAIAVDYHRLFNGRADLGQHEFFGILGAGVVTQSGTMADGAGPLLHAGVGLALPIKDPVGAVVEATYGAAHLPGRAVGDLLLPDQAAWRSSVQVRVALFARPSARPRAIPPQAMPDATLVPAPFRSYEGALLRNDSLRLRQDSVADAQIGRDPQAPPGAVIRRPYLVAEPTDSTPADTTGATGHMHPGRRDNADSAIVLRTAPEMVSAAPTPAAKRAASPMPAAARDTAPSHVPRDTGRAPAPVLPTHVVAPAPQLAMDSLDGVQSRSVGDTSYLQIVPRLNAMHSLRATTIDNLVMFLDSQRNAGRGYDAVITVAVGENPDLAAQQLIDEAYRLQAELMSAGHKDHVTIRTIPPAAGVPPLAIYVRSEPTVSP